MLPQSSWYGEYLDYVSECWDREGLKDGTAIFVSAPDNGGCLAGILSEYKNPDAILLRMGGDRFLSLSGNLRGSAVRMAKETIREAVLEADPPFEVEVSSKRQGDDQTMKAFADEIRGSLGNVADQAAP